MPSPFPGMNPCLKQADVQADFPTNFIARAQEFLTDPVGSKYSSHCRFVCCSTSARPKKGNCSAGVTWGLARLLPEPFGGPSARGFCPIGLRDPLPTIPLPLEEPDPDVGLNLKLVLDRACDAAGYERYVNRGQPEPPLAR